MSDSDDTDILLLIPPNFFMTSAEEKIRKLNKEKQIKQQKQQLLPKPFYYSPTRDFLNETISTALRDFSYDGNEDDYCESELRDMKKHTMESLQDHEAAVEAILMPPPSAAYQFLPTRRKAELNHINSRLAEVEHEDFATPSDISTISNCTVRTQHGGTTYRPQRRDAHLGITHSTPKYHPAKQKLSRAEAGDSVLNEIDGFFDARNYDVKWNPSSGVGNRSDDYQSYTKSQENGIEQEKHASSLPSALNRVSLEHRFNECAEQTAAPSTGPANLISLNEIWGKDEKVGVANMRIPAVSLKEEQLRRQHLERTVRTLQSRLLEYQQRLSVAIEVDRSKDAALEIAQSENKSLQQEVCQLRETVSKLESDKHQHNKKQEYLQNELSQAVNMASKFQTKNEKLEADLSSLQRNSTDIANGKKKQIEELELKLQSSKKCEESTLNDLNKARDKFVKLEYQYEKLKVRCEDLEKECIALRQQKEQLQEYHQKQKNRSDSLEAQKKSMQDTLENLTQNEMTLKKKLEAQQKSLKSHYQQQLENVVAQKLKEFQEQLDKTEETLREEARDRERLIAERAVKQLELINEKNELELNLMQEKQNEEVELYRIQLANASKKIDDLELKLNAYKSKRADIAEKLHDVMETQWQKALEILTSPNQLKQKCATQNNNEFPDNGGGAIRESSTDYPSGTSKSSKQELETVLQKSSPQIDRLQAYIELLLSKSPSDFDRLDEILALSAKSKSTGSKLDKAMKSSHNGKPPWKA